MTNGMLLVKPLVLEVISAWALTLSVQQDWAMREPRNVGQATSSSHALSFNITPVILGAMTANGKCRIYYEHH